MSDQKKDRPNEPSEEKRKSKIFIGGEEVTNPVTKTLIFLWLFTLAVLLAILPILLVGLVVTLKVLIAVALVMVSVHFAARLSGRRGIVQVSRNSDSGVTQIVFNPLGTFDKRP